MAKAPQPEGYKLKDVRLAHAIKVGHNELSYIDSKTADITMHNNLLIAVKKKVGSGSTAEWPTVYTSVFNAISWHRE